jgi:hypothetical protein
MESPKQEQELVSMIDLKNLARTMLPSSSALRDLILSEPDTISSEAAVVKVGIYSRLLYRELKSPSR